MLFKDKRRVWSCGTWELHKITIFLFTHKVLLKKMAMSKTLVSHLAKAAMPVSDWSNERIPEVKHNYSLGCFRQPAGYWPGYFNYLSKAGVLINNTTKYHYDDLPTRQVWPLPTTKRWLIWLFPTWCCDPWEKHVLIPLPLTYSSDHAMQTVSPLSCLKGNLTLVNQKYGKQNYISSCPCCSKNLFENSINRTLLLLLHQMWFGSRWLQAQQISLSNLLSSLHVKFSAEPWKPGSGEAIWELL